MSKVRVVRYAIVGAMTAGAIAGAIVFIAIIVSLHA